jgi:hypothetical protein
MLHDIATIKVPEKKKVITISKPNWHILIDEASGFRQRKFHITKGAIILDMCQMDNFPGRSSFGQYK